jgi:hypothetical protein
MKSIQINKIVPKIRKLLGTRKSRIIALACIVLILLPTILYSLRSTQEVQAWWKDDWHYRASVPVTNNTTTETDRYIEFTGASAIDTSDTTKFQTDCRDLRFVNENGVIFPHFIVSGCGTATTVVHVFFDSFAAGSQTIYYYYGNLTVADGAEGSGFSTEATNYTIGSLGSEETGTAPVAHWKMDEGNFAQHQKSLNKLEQQLNILDQEYTTNSLTYAPTDNSLGLIHWDADKFPGATVYFEAVAKIQCQTAFVALYDTDGNEVSNSEKSTQSGSYAILRSTALTLTDDTDYTVRFHSNNASCSQSLKAARLIIQQDDTTELDTTQTQFELGNVETATSSGTVELVDEKHYYYDSSQYDPAPTSYYEASIKSAQPTIEQHLNILDQVYTTNSLTYVPTDDSLGLIHWDEDKFPGATVYFEAVMKIQCQTAFVALYASSGGSEVSGSEKSTQSTDYTIVRSGSLTLSDDTDYTVRFHSNNASCTQSLNSARLIVQQTDTTKITFTETQIEIGDNQTGITDESAVDLTDFKVYQYDDDLFTPKVETSADASFSATLKIDNSGDTVYAELYNETNSTVVATASHTGDTNWTLVFANDIDSDADWDETNDDEYHVRVYCADGGVDGCSGNIANAKIHLNQFAGGGITAFETMQQQVNTSATDTDDTYTSQEYYTVYNPDLESTTYPYSFGAATLNYFYEATLKTSTATTTTAYAQLYNDTGAAAISSSEVTSTSDTYDRQRSSDITSNLPSWPTTYFYQNMDTQAKNSESSGETTTVSNSWIVIKVSNLSTSGAPTVYSDLYNRTDGIQVTNSEISTTSNTWTRSRSSAITLTTDKEYAARLWTSDETVSNLGRMANAKLIHDQTDDDGLKATETLYLLINTSATDADTGYTDQDFLYTYDPDYDPYLSDSINSSEIHFESTLKTSTGGGSDDAFAILYNDSDTATITGSELETSNKIYTRVRTASSIASNMPTASKNMDTQLKNQAASTTTASNSWIILQNNKTLSSSIKDSASNNHTNANGTTWETECKFENCLLFNPDRLVQKFK